MKAGNPTISSTYLKMHSIELWLHFTDIYLEVIIKLVGLFLFFPLLLLLSFFFVLLSQT